MVKDDGTVLAHAIVDTIFKGVEGKIVTSRSSGLSSESTSWDSPAKYLMFLAQEADKEPGLGSARGMKIVMNFNQSRPVDPLAKPGEPRKPLRLLGEILKDGKIVKALTGEVVAEEPDDGLGKGEDRLEVVDHHD